MASHSVGPDTLVNQMLGHYRIVQKIGAGGMGEVYRARDEHLARDVAIKVLPPGTLIDESARKHFRKEALILSQLNHPNIATIHDFDTQQGVDVLVMEYIPGITLSERVAAGPLPEKDVLRLGVQLAEALSAAHEHGIVHRDLKPGNLRLTGDGRLKILDFGLAKLRLPVTASVATESLSETQIMAGTLPYMAPEQVLGGEIDARTDIHAAGSVLYEMATGRRPFAEVDRSQLIGAILRRQPLPPTALNPRLPPELERIIGKCLEKEPENRYQSAGELAVDLRRLIRELEPGPAAVEVRPLALRQGSFARHWKPIAATNGVVIMLLIIAALWLAQTRRAPETARITPSIAVLPFVDMSPGMDQGYFSDGLAEELLNVLAKIPELRVTARTSSFQFKGKNEDLHVIGEKLNVATVLEGSVRKQGNRVRVTAQLIKVSDGFHLWSETYDRELNDIFAVQDEIARSVAGSLKVPLLGGKTATPSARGANVDAYNAYLQGRYFYERRGKENLGKAIRYYEQAMKLDPRYAPAWVGLARARSSQANGGYLPAKEGYRRAREAAERAMALDPNLAEAHAAMGSIQRTYDWDWAGADASYQQALALEPRNATVVGGAAVLAFTLGRFEEALALDRRAEELDPLSVPTHGNVGLHAYYAGRLSEAVAAFRKALELNPEYPGLQSLLGQVYVAQARPQEALAEMEREREPTLRLQGLALAYHVLGRKKEADAALAEFVAKYHADWAYQIAEVYAFRGEAERAFEWLERAYAQRDGGLSEMKGDPLLKNLEHDPRYAAFLKKMRLPT